MAKKNPTYTVLKTRRDNGIIVSGTSFEVRSDAVAFKNNKRYSDLFYYAVVRCTPGPISRKKK